MVSPEVACGPNRQWPAHTAKAANDLIMWIERAMRIRMQQRYDKKNLYAMHASAVECMGKGKARSRKALHWYLANPW